MSVKRLKVINQGPHADNNCPRTKLGYDKTRTTTTTTTRTRTRMKTRTQTRTQQDANNRIEHEPETNYKEKKK